MSIALGEQHVELPERIGSYRVVCEIGHGGMASLFLARAQGPGGFERLFAIKVIHEHLSRDPLFVHMFLDEARIAARINHPNVVSVYEIGVDRGRHFLAMDYISGETLGLLLSTRIGRGDKISVHLAAHLVTQVCEGLHAAHELREPDQSLLGVVHRDVAPSNVLIGYDGIPRVMDFGVAKARDQLAHTRPGTIKGTLAYMAPEHVKSAELDRRADVFSLGVMLWETVVGKRLFKGKNDIQTTARLLRAKVPRPSSLRADIKPELDDIILKALEREPDRRFETARAMGDALQDFLAAERVRLSVADVERYMRETFPDRHSARVELMARALREGRLGDTFTGILAPAVTGSLAADPLPAVSPESDEVPWVDVDPLSETPELASLAAPEELVPAPRAVMGSVPPETPPAPVATSEAAASASPSPAEPSPMPASPTPAEPSPTTSAAAPGEGRRRDTITQVVRARSLSEPAERLPEDQVAWEPSAGDLEIAAGTRPSWRLFAAIGIAAAALLAVFAWPREPAAPPPVALAHPGEPAEVEKAPAKVEADAPNADAPKADATKADATKADATKADATKPVDASKADATKHADAPKADATKPVGASKADATRPADAPKAVDTAKADRPRGDRRSASKTQPPEGEKKLLLIDGDDL